MRTCRNRSRCIVRNVFNNTYEPTLSVHLVHARHKRGGGDYFDVPIMNLDQMVRISALHTGANVTDSDLLRIQERWRKSCNRRGVVRPYPELGKEADVIIPYPELSKNESCPYFTIHTSSVDKQGFLRLDKSDKSDKLVCQLLLDKKDIVQRVQNGQATLYMYYIRLGKTSGYDYMGEENKKVYGNNESNPSWNPAPRYLSDEFQLNDTNIYKWQTETSNQHTSPKHHGPNYVITTYNLNKMSVERYNEHTFWTTTGVLQVQKDGKRVYSTDAEKEDAYMRTFREDIIKYQRDINAKQEREREELQLKKLEEQNKTDVICLILRRIYDEVYPTHTLKNRFSSGIEQIYDALKLFEQNPKQNSLPNINSYIVYNDKQYNYTISTTHNDRKGRSTYYLQIMVKRPDTQLAWFTFSVRKNKTYDKAIAELNS